MLVTYEFLRIDYLSATIYSFKHLELKLTNR
jgi:hypothetical protein